MHLLVTPELKLDLNNYTGPKEVRSELHHNEGRENCVPYLLLRVSSSEVILPAEN